MGDNIIHDGITEGGQVDPTSMQAAIAQLASLVQNLQGEVVRMQNHLSSAAPVTTGESTPETVPSVVQAAQTASTSPQVMGKLKLSQPKTFSSPQHPGAVENYLWNCEQYFVGMGIPDDRRVFYASGLLDGPIKTWWRHTCTVAQASGTLDRLYVWSTFRTMLLDRFRAVNASRHARDKLASLKQDGLVMTYAQKMQELALQVPDMTNGELLDRFMRGFKPRTRMEVTMREPQTFDEAVNGDAFTVVSQGM
jgi:hypothetical protein